MTEKMQNNKNDLEMVQIVASTDTIYKPELNRRTFIERFRRLIDDDPPGRYGTD